MTRILVQRGTGGSSSASSSSSSPSPSSSSSSNQSRPPSTSSLFPSSSSPVSTPVQTQIGNDNQATLTIKEDEVAVEAQDHFAEGSSEFSGGLESKGLKDDDLSPESVSSYPDDGIDTISPHELLDVNEYMGSGDSGKSLGELSVVEEEDESLAGSSVQTITGTSYPPPPPVPPPRPVTVNSIPRRPTMSGSNAIRTGASSRRAAGWSNMAVRTSPGGSRPSSPRSHCDNDGYNSSDEQNICFGPSYDDTERERQFENDIRRVKGLEVKKMLEDGNCLFRAVADQVYGDPEAYDVVRQMCIDYMERERDHFAQFITEGFTSYCKRKRRDKVYGNNVEIQAMSEMYNRPIHIYSYGTEPINIFHGSYSTDTPPVRLSFHHGNHYNSLVDPRRLTVGAGLGFSSLRGTNVDKDQVKAAIRAQQEQQIDNALLAEGRYYSDLELTEKEIERMVMEASRFEYLANDRFKQQLGHRESSTSRAEPSSSGARSSMMSEPKKAGGGGGGREHSTSSRTTPDEDTATVLSSSMQIVMSMGFSYLQVIEAYSIFGDDVDSMVCYLLETSDSSRRKGKATE